MKHSSIFRLYQHTLLCVLLLLSFLSAHAAQELPAYYITDQLQLGLHTKASLESPVKKLITSGMAVEVLTTKKEFSQIKTPDGTQGWVKTQFLTQDEPAAKKIALLEKDRQETITKYNALSESTAVDSASESLHSAEKETYEDTIAALQEELKAWEQLDSQDRHAQKIQAEKNNQQLKERLAMIASLATGKKTADKQVDISTLGELTEVITPSDSTILKMLKKNYLILLMVAGVSFLFGLFIMDTINRRRHGGYRV